MSQTNTSKKLLKFLPLTTILLLGLALRLYHLDTYSIFFDEKSTMVVSQGIVLEGANQKDVFTKPAFTPADFWATKSLDDYYEAMTRSDIGNSPFYYLLVHGWMDIFGLSDYSARSFSVLFSVLIILTTYLFARHFFSEKTALIAAAIVAFEPFFIAYSHQARNYSLTFFLTLFSTYLFLAIIENERNKTRNIGLYLGYAVVSGLSLLSHFLTISVFLAQGIYALLVLRSVKGWVRLSIAGLVALSGITWWMTMGGGIYSLYTLNYQANLYRKMAETAPYSNPFGIILPATVPNVFERSLPIFSDLYIITNGLADALEGKKNVLLAIAIGLFLALIYRFYDKIKLPDWLKATVPATLLLAGSLVYNNHVIQFSILSVGVFMLTLIPRIHSEASPLQKKRLLMLYLISIVPTLFLIVMSFKNGHTYGLTQRYSGFSFPYMIIIVALLIQYCSTMPAGFRIPIIVLLTFQTYFVGLRLKEFYEDRSVKYGYFAKPRKPNPYYAAAQQLKKLYQPGDTILYPAPRIELLSEMDRTFLPYSVQDAQLTNLYLPKNAQYVQVMDTTQTDHIILKRKDGKERVVVATLKNLRQ